MISCTNLYIIHYYFVLAKLLGAGRMIPKLKILIFHLRIWLLFIKFYFWEFDERFQSLPNDNGIILESLNEKRIFSFTN